MWTWGDSSLRAVAVAMFHRQLMKLNHFRCSPAPWKVKKRRWAVVLDLPQNIFLAAELLDSASPYLCCHVNRKALLLSEALHLCWGESHLVLNWQVHPGDLLFCQSPHKCHRRQVFFSHVKRERKNKSTINAQFLPHSNWRLAEQREPAF